MRKDQKKPSGLNQGPLPMMSLFKESGYYQQFAKDFSPCSDLIGDQMVCGEWAANATFDMHKIAYKRAAASEIELLFVEKLVWVGMFSEIDIKTQVRLFESKKFVWDIYIPKYKICIEINGGVYSNNSGHNSSSGLLRDWAKCNLASTHGCVSFIYDTKPNSAMAMCYDLVKFMENKNKQV